MSPESQREKSLFNAAQELTDPAQRRAFLDAACGGDQALRARIDRLLKASEAAEDFLVGCAPALEAAAAALDPSQISPLQEIAPSKDEQLGSRIGPYKLLQKIGEGGCGIVYMAEQEQPVRRRVALKIIKLGMDTKAVIARFEAERQALAMMDHPNIARVLDAGATEAGRPYFVMELVYGNKITDYCDQNQLAVSERLKIFIQVCQGIQHAHQKGIIHRDIKPSNILVTMHDGEPVPKVIDFGIAKATEQRLTDKTLFTSYAQLIGTPAYMSPEQMEWSGLNLDTRSDIYCLGVLLYELLTGRTPFDTAELLKGGIDEMRRTLREKEPSSPSAKLRTLSGEELTKTAKQRQIDPWRFPSNLRGDLDRVVMKCLEKNRNRRYETANGLAMDIQRHLNNEPVLARSPSRWYKFQKLVRRNRLTFASAAAVTAALLLGTVTSTWLLVKEREALARETGLRRAAEAREKVTQATTQASLLAAREKYDQMDKLLGSISLDKPSTEVAAMFRMLGEWHAVNGRWAQAAERFTKVVKMDQLDAADRVAVDYLELAPPLIESGDLSGYEDMRQKVLARFAGLTEPIGDRVLKVDLLLPANQQLIRDLEPQAELTLATFMNLKEDRSRAPWHAVSLALWEYRRGDWAEAVNWSLRCLGYPQSNPVRTATAHVILAMSYRKMNQWEKALSELSLGQPVIEENFNNGPDLGNGSEGFWFDWAFARILLRECQAPFVEADRSLAQVPLPKPNLESAAMFRVLGEWHAVNGRWRQAAERFTALVKLDQLDNLGLVAVDYLELGPAVIESGDLSGYEDMRQKVIARFAEPTNPVADQVLKMSLLRPANQQLLQDLAPQAEVAQTTFAALNEDGRKAAWHSLSLGLWKYRRGDYANATNWFLRCLACPETNAARSATAHMILAMSYRQMNQWQKALDELSLGRELIETRFDHGLNWGNETEGFWYDWVFTRILLREWQEEFTEVDRSLAQVSVLKPSLESGAMFRALGEWHAVREEWREAGERFGSLLRINQLDDWDLCSQDYLACSSILAESGDATGYQRLREQALARFKDTTNQVVAERIVRASMLEQADPKSLAAAEPLIEVGVRPFTKAEGLLGQIGFADAWRSMSLGLLEYRRGAYDKAANSCRHCLAWGGTIPTRTAMARTVLAMSLYRLGQNEAARSELAKARRIVEQRFKGQLEHGSSNRGLWYDWVFARILLRECQQQVAEADRRMP